MGFVGRRGVPAMEEAAMAILAEELGVYRRQQGQEAAEETGRGPEKGRQETSS
jgi:hypothetical protein